MVNELDIEVVRTCLSGVVGAPLAHQILTKAVRTSRDLDALVGEVAENIVLTPTRDRFLTAMAEVADRNFEHSF